MALRRNTIGNSSVKQR